MVGTTTQHAKPLFLCGLKPQPCAPVYEPRRKWLNLSVVLFSSSNSHDGTVGSGSRPTRRCVVRATTQRAKPLCCVVCWCWLPRRNKLNLFVLLCVVVRATTQRAKPLCCVVCWCWLPRRNALNLPTLPPHSGCGGDADRGSLPHGGASRRRRDHQVRGLQPRPAYRVGGTLDQRRHRSRCGVEE